MTTPKQKAPVRVPDEIRDVVIGICKTYRDVPIARELIKGRLETLQQTEWTDPAETLNTMAETLADTAQDVRELLETTDRIETSLGKKK